MEPTRTDGTPQPATSHAILWQALDGIFGPGLLISFLAHEHDQSIELFFAASLSADWVPGEPQLKAVCALGFCTVYCNFADDTEFVGDQRTRSVDGRRVPGGDYWVMSSKREKVGFPRYDRGLKERGLVLQGADLDLFREFLAWRKERGR